MNHNINNSGQNKMIKMNKPIFSIIAVFLLIAMMVTSNAAVSSFATPTTIVPQAQDQTQSTDLGIQPVSQQTNTNNQVLESPILTNDQAGLNAANNLNNFDLSIENKQSLVQFFNQCPFGIILYKVGTEFFVFCFTEQNAGKLFGLNGLPIAMQIETVIKSTTTNTVVKNSHNDGNNNNNHKNNHKKGGNNNDPDGSCLFNASQPKCDPDENGNCPDGFNLNEDGNCFPDHHEEGCPSGYHGVDDDETGQCYPNDDGCPDGTELNEEGNNCGNIPNEPITEPVTPLDEAALAEDPTVPPTDDELKAAAAAASTTDEDPATATDDTTTDDTTATDSTTDDTSTTDTANPEEPDTGQDTDSDTNTDTDSTNTDSDSDSNTNPDEKVTNTDSDTEDTNTDSTEDNTNDSDSDSDTNEDSSSDDSSSDESDSGSDDGGKSESGSGGGSEESDSE